MSLRVRLAVALTVAGVLTSAGPVLSLQTSPAPEHTFSISAKRYAFSPNRIEVVEGDLVRIDLRTEDIAHSLTIDGYRIAKRVEAGQPVVLEFRAERAGTFPFYCNLQIDDGCRRMRGELVVRPRRSSTPPAKSED
jgi:heme/copper-type cytochrome/quinol oxidase subunit 2